MLMQHAMVEVVVALSSWVEAQGSEDHGNILVIKRSLCTNKLKNSLGMTAMSSSTLQPSLGSELRPTAMDAQSTNNLLTKRC
jgi:hypothetical protein